MKNTFFDKAAMTFAVLLTLSFALVGCDDSDDDDENAGTSAQAEVASVPAPVGADKVVFSTVPTPITDAEKRAILAADTMMVSNALETQKYKIGFKAVMRSGDVAPEGGKFGLLYDIQGNPIIKADGSEDISNSNEHTTLLVEDGEVFMVSQFEDRPGAFYVVSLDQDATTGELSAKQAKPVDFSAVKGGWVHCAGMRTPWMTHLGSEEYEPDARFVDHESPEYTDNSYYLAMADYFQQNVAKDITAAALMNPYDYGYPVEVALDGTDMGTGVYAANASVDKHYAMGRIAYELSYVMPDQKTVYSADDGTNTGFYKFVADSAGDLSSGTLYAAKFIQKDAGNYGYFDIEWIDLGAANSAEIKTMIDSGINFWDIFETAAPIDQNPDDDYLDACPAGFTASAANGTRECLKLKPGMEKAASRLETRRYASYLGATLELRKEEGITFDAERNKLYVAMSSVERGMEARDAQPKRHFLADEIAVEANACGVVYQMDVDANYNTTNMYALVAGRPVTYPESSPYFGNTCDVNGIANPDNVSVLEGYDVLVIGEDTGSGHQNDVIWAYDLNDGTLARIQTTPYGSETTSPYFYKDVNGFGYMMSVIQHPYGESDEDKQAVPEESNAYTGYVGPFPKLD